MSQAGGADEPDAAPERRMPRLAALAVLALAAAAPAQEPDLSGRWAGRWESGTTGHAGPLRGRFARTGPDRYRVVFTGRFWGVVPFRYAQTLTVVGHQGDAVLLAGSSRVPGFGTFEYRAAATTAAFDATFRSRSDAGTFTLRR